MRRPRRLLGVESFQLLAAVAASLLLAATTVAAPILVAGGILLTAGVIGAWARPTFAIVACLVAASLHRGIFLYLRVEPEGYPLSVFDVVPLLILLASVSLAVRMGGSRRATRGRLAACAAMIFAGLVVGAILGSERGADGYELLRVVRLEGLILCVVLAALIAGHIPQWRRAVAIGLMGVALCVAAQLLVTFCWSLASGRYFWSLFPFGRELDYNLRGEVRTGNILNLRENAISGFLILPALSMLVFRARGRDVILLMVLVAGGLVWLSRGLWVAMFLTVLIPLGLRALSGRLSGARLVAVALPAVAVVAVVFLASGGILDQRLGETTDLGGDVSFEKRAAETRDNFTALTEGAESFVFGLGAGVIASPEGRSALLENSVLSTWTNTGLLGLLGVTLLFFGAAAQGWRLASRSDDEATRILGAMALALPVLWLQGFVGGTLSVEQAAVVLFLFAGTVLAAPLQARSAAPQPAITDPGTTPGVRRALATR